MKAKPKTKARGRAPSELARQKRLMTLRRAIERAEAKHAKVIEPLYAEYADLDGYVCTGCGAMGSCPC